MIVTSVKYYLTATSLSKGFQATDKKKPDKKEFKISV